MGNHVGQTDLELAMANDDLELLILLPHTSNVRITGVDQQPTEPHPQPLRQNLSFCDVSLILLCVFPLQTNARISCLQFYSSLRLCTIFMKHSAQLLLFQREVLLPIKQLKKCLYSKQLKNQLMRIIS